MTSTLKRQSVGNQEWSMTLPQVENPNEEFTFPENKFDLVNSQFVSGGIDV